MNSNIKYLKDESNKIFSPVTASDSVMITCRNGSYENIKKYLQQGVTLFTGNVGDLNTITLNDFVYNYRFLIVHYGFDGKTISNDWDFVFTNQLQSGEGVYKTFSIFYGEGHWGTYGVNTYIIDKSIQCRTGWGWTRTQENITSGYFTDSNQVNIKEVIGMK